jgi:DNA polymerase (family 10)
MKNPPVQFPKADELGSFQSHWDLHAHTLYVDGKNTVREMLDAAEAKGMQVFALTEHVRTSALSWWGDYVMEIRQQRRGRRMKVLIGFEANAIGPSGTVDVPDAMWEDAELALGSVHGYYHDDGWEKISDGSLPADEALAYEVDKALGLCHNPRIHVLAHPGWLFGKHYGDMPEAALRTIFRAACETGTAVEINVRYLRNPKRFMKLLQEENPTVSFGSNAHSIHEISDMLEIVQGMTR